MSRSSTPARNVVACLVFVVALCGAGTAQAAPGMWSPTDSMDVARSGHTSTLLTNGLVLIAGSQPASSYGETAEVYNPVSNTFSPTDAMDNRRSGHTATRLADGRVLVAGGVGGFTGFTPLASAEVYNPVTKVWSPTDGMDVARAYHTATLLADGRVLVAGGQSTESGDLTASAEIYNPATGMWSPTDAMDSVRSRHTATLLEDGRVLAAGGQTGSSSTITALAELYDPTTGTWSPTDAMDTARSFHRAALLEDGRVLVASGYAGSSSTRTPTAELYDPATGMWSATDSMDVGRSGHTATLLMDGRVLVAGGYTGSAYEALAEIYDPASGMWSPTASMDAGRSAHSATLLNDGRVLAAGGAPGPLTSAEVYEGPPPEDSVEGSGRIGSGASSNDFAFDAHSAPDGTSPTGTISFTEVANPSKKINGEVVCLRASGNRAVIVYEDAGAAQTGGIINVVDGSPDRQKNGRLAKNKVNAYRTGGCPAVATGTLPAIASGSIAVTDS